LCGCVEGVVTLLY